MAESITLTSANYSGDVANILFKPDNLNISIDLGYHILPYTFNPSLLIPPREFYGEYDIKISGGSCEYIVVVPRPTLTPTPTPTNTPTSTPTSTPTPTPSPTSTPIPTATSDCPFPPKTPTPTASNIPTSTPLPSPTPTPTDCPFPPSDVIIIYR